MFKKSKVSTAALLALSGGLTLATLPAFAQSSARVEITGSRIKSLEVDSASPVVSVTAESIKVEGVRSVEQLLNNLPQVFADYGGTVSNGSTGTATVNLRGLGASRTLVLVNGHRVPAGSPRFLPADLNAIPVPLIKRVEVLTGGASAVYGSDALAGVVNFIMNDSFQGVQFEANHSFYNHSQKGDTDYALRAAGYPIPGDKSADGKVSDLSVTLGGNFAGNKGNATVFIGYKKEDALLQSERDFSACSLGTAGDVFSCAGSGTSFPGRFRGIGLSASTRDWTLSSAGTPRPFNTATDLYNFGPLNYFQRPSERYTAAGFARYDISDMARAYVEMSFHDDSTVAQIAPSGLFGVRQSIAYENPLLTDDWRTALKIPVDGSRTIQFNRRNVEGGGRQDDIRHTSYRMLSGVKGDVGPWSYDAFAQVGRVAYQETYKNDFSITRAQRAMDVIIDPATGRAACRTFVDGTDPSCVPYNIWRSGGVTPEALAYLQTPGFQKGFTAQRIVGFNGSVDLGGYGVKLPTATNGLGLAFGAEHRRESMELSTDQAFTSGDLAGQGGPTIGVGGAYTVKDYFLELRVPLIDKKPFADLLDFTASYRKSDYSTGASADSFGAGLQYAPVREVKLRGSVQRAVRSANIIELYSAQSLGLFNLASDPCSGTAPTATLAQCLRTGVTAAQYGTGIVDDNPAGQFNAIFGGNPRLKPETADTVTLGLVLQPLKGLTVTADYFDIKVTDQISALDPGVSLRQCLDTGNPTFCGNIHRDSDGSLWNTNDGFIRATNFNVGKLTTKGFDLGLDYQMKLAGAGQLDFSLLGTALQKLEIEPIRGLGSYDCAGFFGSTCGTPSPKWRHKLRTTWTSPFDLGVSLTWRYFGGTTNELNSTNPQLNGGSGPAADPVNAKFKGISYLDLATSYNIGKNLTLRLAINNLLDKDPPLSDSGAPFGNGNTYPVVYDALGRRFSFNVTAKF